MRLFRTYRRCHHYYSTGIYMYVSRIYTFRWFSREESCIRETLNRNYHHYTLKTYSPTTSNTYPCRYSAVGNVVCCISHTYLKIHMYGTIECSRILHPRLILLYNIISLCNGCSMNLTGIDETLYGYVQQISPVLGVCQVGAPNESALYRD